MLGGTGFPPDPLQAELSRGRRRGDNSSDKTNTLPSSLRCVGEKREEEWSDPRINFV